MFLENWKKKENIFCLISHGHSCRLGQTKPYNPSVQIRSPQNLSRWIMAQLCVQDMSNVLAGSPKEQNSAVRNNFFYLEQQRLFTLTCWSLSELGGGRLWQVVEKLTSSTNGAAETLRLRKLVNDTTRQTLYIPQTKKQEAFCPFVSAAGPTCNSKRMTIWLATKPAFHSS